MRRYLFLFVALVTTFGLQSYAMTLSPTDYNNIFLEPTSMGAQASTATSTPTIVGTWRWIQEAGAFGYGPSQNDIGWYSSSAGDVTTRACEFDDEFVINADGTFLNVLGNSTWLEAWEGTAGCGTPVTPFDGSANATYVYDADAGTLTISGTGAYMGLKKVINGGEISSSASATASITYQASLSTDGNSLDLDINAGAGWWQFKFERVTQTTTSTTATSTTSTSTTSTATTALPYDDFEGGGNISWDFGTNYDATLSTVSNTFAGGINTSNKIGRYEDNGGQYAHIAFVHGQKFDLSSDNIFRVKVYVPTPSTAYTQTNTLAIKLQDNDNSTPWVNQVVIQKQYVYDEWQELVFDFSDQANATIFDKVVVQFNSENNNEAVVAYIDDFKLTDDNSAPATVPVSPIVGTWRWAQTAAAFGYGPNQNDISWYSNPAGDLTTRACEFDDEFVINADGTFQNVLGNSTWLEAWEGSAGCGTPVTPFDGSANATYVYDADAGTLTISGTGAYMGLKKIINGGEISSSASATASITYQASLSTDGNSLDLDINAGAGWWQFKFERVTQTTTSTTATSTTSTSTTSTATTALPYDDFEGGGNISWDFGTNYDATLSTVSNTFAGGINTSNKIGRYEDNGGQYAHIAFVHGQKFDLSSDNIFRVKVYVPTPSTAYTQTNTLAIKLQDNDNSTPWVNQVVIQKQYVYDEWQELVFDFSDQANATIFDKVVVQFNSENNNEAVVAYIDDFKLTDDNSAPATVPVSPIVGTWRWAQTAAAFGYGPNQNDISWYSNPAGDLTTRACEFDDEFVINADGTFQNVLGNSTWLEAWEGSAGCGTPVTPFDGSANATYVYDADAGTLTISGTGAYMGLKKIINGGEISSSASATASITYQASLSTDGNSLDLDINAGAGWWQFKFERVTQTTTSTTATSTTSTSTTSTATTALPYDDFEGGGNISWDFGTNYDATLSTVSNTFAGGINTSNKIGRYEDNGGQYAHIAFVHGQKFDLSSDNIFRVKVYVPTPSTAYTQTNTLAIKLQDNDNSTPWVNQVVIQKQYVYDEWQELVFDFSDQANATIFDKVVVQFNSENNNEAVVAYIDDFKLTDDNSAPATVPVSPIVGTWRWAQTAAAFGYGPNQNDISWYSNPAGDLTTRACEFDDEFVINADGTFQNVLGNSTWLEAWEGSAGCGTPVTPFDGSANATYVYDADAGTLTISGTGAYMGLKKIINGGEISSSASATASITYQASLSTDGNSLDLDINAGAGWWQFKFERVTQTTTSTTATSTTSTSTTSTATTALPYDDFEGGGNISWDFGTNYDATLSTVSNTFAGGINTSNKIGRYEDNGGQYAHIAFVHGQKFDLSSDNIFRVKVYVPTPSTAYTQTNTLAIKLQDNDNSTPWVNQVVIQKQYVYDEWQELVFDFSDQANATIFDKVVVQFNSENNNEAVVAYIDDFKLTDDNSAPATVPVSPIVGTWRWAQTAAAFGYGPNQNDISWYSNPAGDLTTRACEFDDEFVINADGTFQNVLGNSTWLEAWEGSAGCGTPVTPFDGSANATYVYDADAGTLTISGTGAYMGLKKIINGGEISSSASATASITYQASLSTDGNSLDLDINAGAGWWQFKFERVAQTTTSTTATSTTSTSTTSTATTALPYDDFEGGGNISWDFGTNYDATLSTVSNTFAGGINTSNKIGRYEDNGGQYAHIAFVHGQKFDLSSDNIFRVKVYVPTPSTAYTQTNTLAIKLQDNDNSTPWVNQVVIQKQYVYDEWQELVFDFSDQANATIFDKVVVQFNSENNNEAVVAYIDDFKLTDDNSAPATVPVSPIVGTWRWAQTAAAFGVGPNRNDISWYSNSAGDLTTRACEFDDEFVINADGTFQNVLGNSTWLEAWEGAEGCGTPVAPFDGSANATYVYDADAGTLTISGTGAYMGLKKVINGGEISSSASAAASITYFATLSDDGNELDLDIQISNGWWQFKFEKATQTTTSTTATSTTSTSTTSTGAVTPTCSQTSSSTQQGDTITTGYISTFETVGSTLNITFELLDADKQTGLVAFLWKQTPFAETQMTQSSPGVFTQSINGVSDGDVVSYAAKFAYAGGFTVTDYVSYTVGSSCNATTTPDSTPTNSPMVGTWRWAQTAGAFGVGPNRNDISWYSNSANELNDRACEFDDEFVFNADGTFQNVLGNSTWLEAWEGAQGCGTPVAPFDGSANATYMYDADAGTLTISGTGAYMGLKKVINGTEISSSASAAASITYFATLSDDGTELDLDIQISNGWWQFKFEKAATVTPTCRQTSTSTQQGDAVTTGYISNFETAGETLNITFELLDADKQTGLVAYLWKESPFEETQMTQISPGIFTHSVNGVSVGDVVSYAAKFAYAGGLTVTDYISYTVGSSCDTATSTSTTSTPSIGYELTTTHPDRIVSSYDNNLDLLATFTEGVNTPTLLVGTLSSGTTVQYTMNAVAGNSSGTQWSYTYPLSNVGTVTGDTIIGFTVSGQGVNGLPISDSVSSSLLITYDNTAPFIEYIEVGDDENVVDVYFTEDLFSDYISSVATGTVSVNDFSLTLSSTTANLTSATPTSFAVEDAFFLDGKKYSLGFDYTGEVVPGDALIVNIVADTYDIAGNPVDLSLGNNSEIYQAAEEEVVATVTLAQSGSGSSIIACEEVTIFANFSTEVNGPISLNIVDDSEFSNTRLNLNMTGVSAQQANAPSEPAPAPIHPGSRVLSIFSDSYTNLDPINLNPDWGQTTQTDTYAIDGNNTLVYGDLNYQGTELGGNQDVSGKTHIHLDYWVSEDTTIRFFLISPGPAERAYTLPVQAGQWNSIDIALTEFTGVDLSNVFQFKVDAGDGAVGLGATVYWDNIYFHNGSPNAPAGTTNHSYTDFAFARWKASFVPQDEGLEGPISISVSKGGAQVAAGDGSVETLVLDIDMADCDPPLQALTSIEAAISHNAPATNVDTCEAITVTASFNTPLTDPVVLTIFDEGTETATSVTVTMTAAAEAEEERSFIFNPVVSAPVPTLPEDEVLSIFSESYPNVIGTDFYPNWGQSTGIDFPQITSGGNQSMLYSNLNYQGTQFAAPLNLSDKTHLHIDYWTADATELNFYLISPGPAESGYALPIVSGQWNSVDIALSEFASVVNLADVIQFKVDTPNAGTSVYFDNIYFHSQEGGTRHYTNPQYTDWEVSFIPNDFNFSGILNFGVSFDGSVVTVINQPDAIELDRCRTDTDGDGVYDDLDICPGTQAGLPVNEDGCSEFQVDVDEDGVPDYLDNCVDTPNSDQLDNDGDGIGNVCDPDPSIVYVSLEVSENASPTTQVVIFEAFNSLQDTITLTLSDTSGLFELSGNNAIVLVGALDFETNEFHIVELTATTESGGIATESITIMVSDIPNTTYTGKFFVSIFDNEDETQASKVDHTRYFNPFNKGVGKWNVRKRITGGADAALFTIRPGASSSSKNDEESEGTLEFLSAPDFENPLDHNGDNIYEVEITYENLDDGAQEVPVPVTQRNIQMPENTTTAIELQSNPALPTDDTDNDGVPDIQDNSPLTFNPNQVDEDGDGIGDVSDDFDHDGVWNPYDTCPDTPLGEVVDENGCVIFYTSSNNFSLSKTEKCAGEHQIELNVRNYSLFDYQVSVTGPETAITNRALNSSVFRLRSLAAGSYNICVTVDGIPTSEFERCFTVTLDDPAGLSVLEQFSTGDEVVNFQLKGGTNFTIVHNGKTIQTSDSNYALRLAKGVNKVRITNGIECQGVYERTFMNSYDVTVAPNPVQEQMQLFVGGSDTEALVEIFTSDGKQVFGQVFSLSPVNRNIKVDTHTLTEGTYYVKVQASTVKQSKLMIKE